MSKNRLQIFSVKIFAMDVRYVRQKENQLLHDRQLEQNNFRHGLLYYISYLVGYVSVRCLENSHVIVKYFFRWFTNKRTIPYLCKVRRGYVSSVYMFHVLKVSSNREKLVMFYRRTQ